MPSITPAPTVRRTIALDTDRAGAWSALADADGLAGWLASAVELDVPAGAAGRLVDHDGTARRLVVTDVVDGERLAFAWWSEQDPTDASSVVITLAPTPEGIDGAGGVELVVTETFDPGALAVAGAFGHRADACFETEVVDLAAADAAWGARSARLADRLVPAFAS